MVGLGYVLTGSRPVAEELVQDTFAEAHRRWSQIADYDKPGAWLRRVLVNNASSRRRRLVSEAKAMTRLRTRRVENPSIPESSEHVWAAVRRLPTRQSQAIALHYLEDMTVAQIAEVLDCGEETVKTHLRRGRARLAAELGAEANGGVR